MTRVAEPIEEAADQDDDAAPEKPRAWFAILTLGFVLQVAWRVLLSWPLTGPIAHVDEDGYMFGARVLAGGPDATVPSWSIMRPIGYPLTLVPAYLFAEQLPDVYRIVHVINALLMASTFPLIYFFARRLFDLGRWWAAGVAFVLAALPSMVFFSEFALTDALLPLLVMSMLACVYQMFTTSGRSVLWYAAGAGAIGAYAANTHVRGQVMLVVLAGTVALAAWRRWVPRAVVLYGLGAAVVVYGLGWIANKWLEDQLFATVAYSADGRVKDRLLSIKGIALILCNSAGQIWHLCASTYGLAAIGLVATVWALYKRQWTLPTRIVLGMALAITVFIALATAAGTPVEGRVNNHMYGRYVAMFAAFWVLIGVVALAKASWRRALWLLAGGAGITLLSGAAVLAYAGGKMRKESFVNFDAPELAFLSNDWTWGPHVNLVRILQMTLYAVLFMALFTVLLRPWGRAAIATGAAVLVLNGVAMVSITTHISQQWVDDQYHSSAPQLVRDIGIRPGDTVVEDPRVGWWVNTRHQHEIYWDALPAFDPAGPPPTALYVIARANDSSGKPGDATIWDGTEYGYVLIATKLERGYGNWAVWRRT